MNISSRLYGLLLFVYPAEFRREFGHDMLQVFRDSYRDEARAGSLPGFWLRMLLDLASTALKERVDGSQRRGVMNRRSDLVALLGCIGIIVIAFAVHRYAITNNIPFIFFFGYILDALIVAGVIGNFIVFLLAKTTKLNPLRTAITVFAVVHGALLLLIVLISSRIGPPPNWLGVLTGYIVSYVFWVGLHFAWRFSHRLTPIDTD
jgi:hypothetical protein